MKKVLFRIIISIAVIGVAVAVFLIGFFYVRTVSDKIYVDSTNQLKETYKIVGRSTKTYIEQKWRVLNDWKRNVTDDDFNFTDRKGEWRFYEFYFIGGIETEGNDKVSYLKSDGTQGFFGYDDDWQLLLSGGNDRILTGEELGDGQQITVFAVSVNREKEPHIFNYGANGEQSFDYSAIAISFENDNIAYALNTNPYGDEANCFVIHSDGRTLFSMEEGGGIYGYDYFKYLLAPAHGVDKGFIDNLEENLANGKEEDLVNCKIDGENHCVYYQKLNYQDYYIISVVPQKTISSGFLSVQRNTTLVFVSIFSIIGIAVIAFFVFRIYKQSRKSTLELKYREQMFDVLSNSVDDIFIMLNRENQHVDYLSPNIEPLLGISVKEARSDVRKIAKCAVDYNIIIPKENLAEIPVNGSKFWECEYMHQSTGERRWYRVTIYNLEIQGVYKYIVVMSDRTVEQQMNQNLQEAFDAAKSANEAKSNFLSNMSHDIRTPMNAIVGFSVLLEKDADNPEKVREYTRKITASGHHLLSIINDVLDMSKIENGKTSLNIDCFSLPKLLEEISIIIMPQAKAKAQAFTISVKGNPPEEILGDRLRLNRILMNILSNAVKYTQEGGKISFTVTNLTKISPQFAKLRFEVRDNGIGMSEEYQKQLFVPFSREINSVTNKVQGTGLGMAITKSLVDLMGGIISVESAPGEGSTFTVELSFPLADRKETDLWFKQNVSRMLVADDEEDICLNIKEIMSDSGVEADCVYSGSEAVDAAIKAHKNGKDYDVILLDWKMPGMDGVETARKIRSLTDKKIPILVLTSYDWEDIESEARKAGIDAFMSKPFFISTFQQTIRHLFDKQPEAALPASGNEIRGKKFLIVEDNDLNAEILTEMLSMEGAESELAVNGKEAVEKFLSVEPERYDMILMDVQMPIMNGYEATRQIRASEHPRAKTIPIVAMTANAFAEDVRNALDAGMDGHLAKPIDMNKVKELIGKLLSTKENIRPDNDNDQSEDISGQDK